MENKKNYKKYYKYNNSNEEDYNYYEDEIKESKIYDNNENKEIKKLLNIIDKLKSKNSMLIKENKKLKYQIRELKTKNNNNFNNNYNNRQPKGNNCIYAEYTISEDETNKDIRILNHDEITEENNFDDSYGPNYYTEGTDNQEEIEDSCLIFFGKKPIKFSETFNFYKPGKYTFIFEFKYKLSNINKLFKDCNNLFSADFSRFDSSALEQFDSLFENCSNLKYIDFSRIYLPSSKKAENVFYGVHEKCRLICKDKNLITNFNKDKDNFSHKDDYYDYDYDYDYDL